MTPQRHLQAYVTCLFVLALAVGCGGGGGNESPYRGTYEGTIGWDYKPASLRIDEQGSIQGTLDGQSVTGRISDTLNLSFVNARFEWDGKVLKDVGVQPFFRLVRVK